MQNTEMIISETLSNDNLKLYIECNCNFNTSSKALKQRARSPKETRAT